MSIAYRGPGSAEAWASYSGTSVGLAALGFFAVTLTPHAQGSGLPGLITYLNGVKLHLFTSSRTLLAKFLGTVLTAASGLCAGPEAPIIHLGAGVGKQLLRTLYHAHVCCSKVCSLRVGVLAEFVHLKNDLDQRDWTAIGAGAGIAAAFYAPLSGTLFVVEEASSHFSLQLLW